MKSLEYFEDKASRRISPFERNDLLVDARLGTALADFGDPPLEPALSILLNGLEHAADLTALGRFLVRGHLLELLEIRLRLTENWSHSNAFERIPISRPVFITGMPRSGSTFLHELLAGDPANRAPRAWEVMFPIPAPRRDHPRNDWRRLKAAARLRWFRRLAPGAAPVHPLRASAPQGCAAIQSYTLLSEEFVATYNVPSYKAFLHSTDLGPAYLWQRRFLQYLQSRDLETRWILKSPHHVYGLEELFAIFPDAVVIQTHRDPLKVLRSSTEPVDVLDSLFLRRVDADRIAQREASVLADAIDHSTRFRDTHPQLAHRFIDVRYTELVTDPLAVVRRIYDQLQIHLTDRAAELMHRLAASRSRYPKRFGSPTLAQLGLDVLAEARRFEQYCFRFGVGEQESALAR
jgi:Sulfotransferase family